MIYSPRVETYILLSHWSSFLNLLWNCWAIGVVLHGVDRQSHEQILQRVEGYGDQNLPGDQNLHCVWRCFKFAIVMVILWLCWERKEEELWVFLSGPAFERPFFKIPIDVDTPLILGPKWAKCPLIPKIKYRFNMFEEYINSEEIEYV